MINEIKGNNIILREQKIEDVKFFTYWYNQPLVMFQCGFTKLTDEEAEKERITIGHKQKDSVWYTITDLEGNIIGETGLLRMWPDWNCTDLSIIIPDPKIQQRWSNRSKYVTAAKLLKTVSLSDFDVENFSK